VTINGELRKGRKDGEWELTLNYTANPTTLCWVLAILGLVFFVFGVLILLVPFMAKSTVQTKVHRAIRDARDDIESGKGASEELPEADEA
jgi:hypothetical protein